MYRITLLSCLAFLATTACKKDKEEEAPAPPPPAPTATHVALFRAEQAVDDYGSGPVESSIATATILTAAGIATTVDSVWVNDLRLSDIGTGTYIVTSFSGLDLSTGTLVWDLAYEAAGISFTHDASDMAYPVVSDITSGGSVPRGSSYTLSCGTVTGADSVRFVLGGLRHTLPGNATSHTFTAAQVSTLGPELYNASITAVHAQSATYDGMACRFRKDARRSVMVLVE